MINFEELIEAMIKQAKQGHDLSAYQKSRTTSPLAKAISTLASVPKAKVDYPDFNLIRSKIIEKISKPVEIKSLHYWFTPKLRLTAGIVGSFLIGASLTIGSAVAALESVPGDSIYPLKKVVENIQLRLTSDESERSNLQLKFAENRINELEKVLEQKEEGKLSSEEVEKIVAETIKDLKKTTSGAVAANAVSAKPKTAIVGKLSDLSLKLRSASIKTEGEVKLELEKAAAATTITKEQAIANMERAGLQVENDATINLEEPLVNTVSASGALTAVSEISVSLGTSKFFLTKDTKYNNAEAADLKVGLIVTIKGEIKDNKTFAQEITLIQEGIKGEAVEAVESQ